MTGGDMQGATTYVNFKGYQQPWPVFGQDERDATLEVLESGKVNYWTGDEGRKFEREFADYFDVRRAIAMANGTVTLQACLRAIGLQAGDEVVTTPRTFIASSSAVVLEGGIPVMADVDRDSGNITAESIERVLTNKTRAIIPVHLAGWPCEMDAIVDLARKRGIHIIEDCAQCHGATYRGKHCGTMGTAASWSFCQDKIMTTAGEGGMVGTDDEDLWRDMWAMKDHGKSYKAVYETEHEPGFRWLHESWGTNWRLTETQSAVGRVQLRKLPEWSELRRRNAMILEDRLRGNPVLRVPIVPDHMRHAYYKLYAYLQPEALKPDWSRQRILHELEERGVPGLSGSCSEIYLEKAFVNSGMGPKDRLPVAQELGETSVMFQVHPTLNAEAMHVMADVIESVVEMAAR